MDNEKDNIYFSLLKNIAAIRRHPDASLVVMALVCLAEILSLGIILHNSGVFRFLLLSTWPGLIFFLLIIFGVIIVALIIYAFWRHQPKAKIPAIIFSSLLILLAMLHLLLLRIHFQQSYLEGSKAIEYQAHLIAILIIALIWVPVLIGALLIIPDSQ